MSSKTPRQIVSYDGWKGAESRKDVAYGVRKNKTNIEVTVGKIIYRSVLLDRN